MSHAPAPMTLARLQAALAAVGASPRKRHGQHFLWRDEHLAAIVARAAVGPGDTVLEVGPGPGLLTRHLLAAGADVVAVEIDPAMRRVADRLLDDVERLECLEWIEADVLAGTRRLSPPVAGRLVACDKLVANLPYNVSAPLIALVLGADEGPERLVVTVQREVADRLLSGPSSPDYGPLSVQVALRATGEIVRPLSAGCFWPPPRVRSAIVDLRRRSEPLVPLPEGLDAFLSAAFHNRRKTLVNSLSTAVGEGAGDVIARLGLDKNQEKVRAEALSPVQLCTLATRWADHAPGGRLRP